jgi:formylglycine-generating enzyme required for sulfatase activity
MKMTKKAIYILGTAFILVSLTNSADIKLPKPYNKVFKFIPSGLVKLDDDTLSVQAFYILDHEVTNGEYLTFYNEIKGDEIKRASEVREENWSSELPNSLDNYTRYYLKHPAYSNYPVVNVTYEGAMNYCKWLQEKINTSLAGKSKVKVRLPFHVEIIRAATGDDLTARYSWKKDHLIHPEGGFMCNFTVVPQGQLTRDTTGTLIVKKDLPISMTSLVGADVLAPSKSYYPSEFGVYNLNGNAAEMTIEKHKAVGGSWKSLGYDVRIQSQFNYEESSCKVGFRPVFTVVN